MLWGTQQKSVSRPARADGRAAPVRRHHPALQPVHLLLRPRHRPGLLGWCCSARARALYPRAALDRETLGGAGVKRGRALHLGVSCSPRSWAASAAPSSARCAPPRGHGTESSSRRSWSVVIGGLGSFWGTFLGAAHLRSALLRHPLFPRFSIFAVFALMAAVLMVRPWGLLGRPLR